MPDQRIEDGTTRATARLPGLDIEIVHRRPPGAEVEQISINLQAVPSFEAFGRFLETTNPFAFWARAAQMGWLPWLGAARSFMLPGSVLPALKVNQSGTEKKPRNIMPVMSGFGALAGLPWERITDKIERRILEQGMIVWWKMKAGVHAASHQHPHEQIVWMLNGRMDFSRQER
ncbi:MAG: hypothetical protein WA858_20075 [Xanthobacteraceae bacterium]